MKIIRGLKALKKPLKSTALSMGVFDGVHVGHRKIIKRLVEDARRKGLVSVVVTFQPHPTKVVSPDVKAPSLISLDHRIRLIEELGVGVLVVLKFSRAMADISAKDFAREILIGKLGMRRIYIGNNFYFGKGGRAGAKELQSLGRALGFKVTIIGPVKKHGSSVSSSRIRSLITSGRLDEASALLGRRVAVMGTVVGGACLARELGYPTANLNPHHEVVPPGGVYAVLVRFEDRVYKGVLNIGVRPTFYAPRDQEPAIEVHIFDFHKKIYGKDMEVFFIKKLRNEVAFGSKNELVKQIKDDEKRARNVLKGQNIDFS